MKRAIKHPCTQENDYNGKLERSGNPRLRRAGIWQLKTN